MADVDVFADAFKFTFATNASVKGFVVNSGGELAMGDEIGVSTNRGGEMGVDL